MLPITNLYGFKETHIVLTDLHVDQDCKCIPLVFGKNMQMLRTNSCFTNPIHHFQAWITKTSIMWDPSNMERILTMHIAMRIVYKIILVVYAYTTTTSTYITFT